MPKQRYDRNSVVQGKGNQSAHILLTPECGEKRTAETSRIAFAADRTAECFSKRHLYYSYVLDEITPQEASLLTGLNPFQRKAELEIAVDVLRKRFISLYNSEN